MLVFAGVIIGIMLSLSVKTTTISYTNETKQRHEVIAERATAIYNSDEFQAEMLKLATARALFEMSNETQTGAVELSEMAVMSYDESQRMATDWHNLQ